MSWLSGLRLSITQWALVSLVSVIGLLIAALKLQGGRLHQAQVALLSQRLLNETEKEDGRVAEAMDALKTAVDAYRSAK